MRRYHHILDVAFGVGNELMKLLFRLVDTILIFPGDVNLIFSSSMRSRWDVAIDLGEWRREIDGGFGGGFNESNILASSTTDDCMQGQLEFHDIDFSFKLCRDQ